MFSIIYREKEKMYPHPLLSLPSILNSTTALSAAGNSGLLDPHDTTPGAVEQRPSLGHTGTSLCSDRFPRPPLPAPPHPGTAEAADEFFLAIVL